MTKLSVSPTYHESAKCRWCHGRFQKLEFLQEYHWLCENPVCAARQITHARRKVVGCDDPLPDGSSPYWFVPLPLGVELSENTTKRLLIEGPRGTGKSVTSREYLYDEAIKYPGLQALILRRTYGELYENHLLFMEQEQHQIAGAEFKERPVRHMAFRELGKGSRIVAGFCKDVDDIPGHIGTQWDIIVLEEGVHLLTKALEDIPTSDRGSKQARMVLESVGRVTGRTRIITNPGGRSMMHLRDFYKERNPNPLRYDKYKREYYGALTSTVEDNPYLPPDYKESTLGGLNSQRGAQLADGRWDRFEGQFFEEFDPTIHVVE